LVIFREKMAKLDVSIIIVNMNGGAMFLDSLDSVYSLTKNIKFEIIVVDNNSVDGSCDLAQKYYPNIKVIQNRKNLGFSRAVNQGLKEAKGRYIFLLNNDAILDNSAIEELVKFMDSNCTCGIAGVQLINRDGSKQNSYDNFPRLATVLLNKGLLRFLFPKKYPSKIYQVDKPIEVESVIGAALMIRKEVIDKIGELDENYFWSLEETDWCLRARKWGWKIFFVPEALVLHLQGKTKEKFLLPTKVEYLVSMFFFFKKNRSSLEYLLLRFLFPFKITVSFVGSLVMAGFTLFLVKNFRKKFLVNGYILLWHFLFCPKWMTLRGRFNPSEIY